MDQLQYFPKKKVIRCMKTKHKMIIHKLITHLWQRLNFKVLNIKCRHLTWLITVMMCKMNRSMPSIPLKKMQMKILRKNPPLLVLTAKSVYITMWFWKNISMTCIGKNYFLAICVTLQLQIKTHLPTILSHGTKLHKLSKRVNPFWVILFWKFSVKLLTWLGPV